MTDDLPRAGEVFHVGGAASVQFAACTSGIRRSSRSPAISEPTG
jgi:hypothetical protein